jgi:LysR family transcriptional regulator, hydrogen peroxide-inducible genes activator
MNDVTLRQLRYLDALAQSLHFGRAAEQCSISQPALSMQIQELERQIGAVLVERKRQGVHLTDEGEEIARRTARILSNVRDLVEYAQQRHRLLSGRLRLGVIPTIAPYLLPPLLSLLRADYPNLELYLHETQAQHLASDLVCGKLDVVLLALPVEHVDIESVRLFADRFLLALPRSRRLPAKMLATPDLMLRYRLLLLDEGHCHVFVVVADPLGSGFVKSLRHQYADAPHVVGLLRVSRERPCHRRAADERDELAPLHVFPCEDNALCNG